MEENVRVGILDVTKSGQQTIWLCWECKRFFENPIIAGEIGIPICPFGECHSNDLSLIAY